MRFSITNILLAILVVALGRLVYDNQRKLAEVGRQRSTLANELGEIEVSDRSKVHLRVLHSPAIANCWQFRIYVPKDADYVVAYDYQVDARPTFGGKDAYMTLPTGQYTVTVEVGEDLLKPNDTAVQCLMVSVPEGRAGLSFRRKEIRPLANSLGNYDNQWNRREQLLAHNSTVDQYSIGSEIPLVGIFESGNPFDDAIQHISIRLIPRPKKEQSAE